MWCILNGAGTKALRRTTTIRHVLVVEDDANDARLTTRFLNRWKHPLQVHVATGIEAAKAFLEETPEVSLVLLDHMLPGCSGLDLLKTFRAEGPHRTVPVVVLTGNSDGKVVQRACEAGANSCVLKPVDPEEYERTVASIAEFWLGANLIARRAVAL